MGKIRRKLSVKLALVLVLLMLVMGGAITMFSYTTARKSYLAFYGEKAQQAATLASGLVDGDKIAGYLDTGVKDEYYNQLYARFQDIKRSFTDIWFLYIVVPDTDHWTYVLDAMLPEENPDVFSEMGAIYYYDETDTAYMLPIVESGVFQYPETTRYVSTSIGTGVEMFAPVYDSAGKLVAMVGSDVSITTMAAAMNQYLRLIIAISVGIILVMLAILLLVLRRSINEPLKKLTEMVSGFVSDGGLAAQPESEVRTGDEFQLLSETFVKMAGDIVEYTNAHAAAAADRERMSTELNVAANMQMAMLPKGLPDFPARAAFDVQGFIRPSPEMGGDFYDYFVIEDRWVCFIIADVQAIGISAAMLLVITKTIIKSQLLSGDELDTAMTEVNRQIFTAIGSDIPVNAFVGVLDAENGGIRYLNAGYRAPLLLRRGGRYEPLTTPSVAPLGVSENVSYRQLLMTLHQGDRLFLYSDGLTGAKNAAGEEFGDERVEKLLNATRAQDPTPTRLLKQVFDEMESFAGTGQKSDDVTMLCLEYQKGDREKAEITLTPQMSQAPELLNFLRGQMTANGVPARCAAQVSVIAEELFSLCCRRSQSGARVTARCEVPPNRPLLRLIFTGELGGTDPFADEKDTAAASAAVFIRKVANSLDYAQTDGEETITVTKKIE